MSLMKGKNSIDSAAKMLINRTAYKVSAFSENNGLGPNQVTDFTFSDYVNYGRIDPNHNVVYVDTSHLVSITTDGADGTVPVLPFVAEAFKGMQKDFENALFVNKISRSNSFLSQIKPYLGYVDPYTSYSNYIYLLFQEFINDYIIENKNGLKILNIEQFLNHFLNFLKLNKKSKPVTLTEWHRSKYSSLFSSGLAISIANFPLDDDEKKTEFMASQEFEYFKKVCVKRGFSISHNSPWVIVADLGSPKMKQNYSVDAFTVTSLFSKYYRKTHLEDMDILKINIIRHYNDFVNKNSFEKKHHFCKNNKLQSEILKRKKITQEVFDSKFDIKYMLLYYYNIRNIEVGREFNKQQIKKKSQNIINLYKILDKDSILDYINREIKLFNANKIGSLNWYLASY